MPETPTSETVRELQPDRTYRFGQGWKVVARKEFADHLLSARFLVVVGILAVAAAAAVFAASGGIRSVASDALGVPALFL
jgi:ABC-2 type transport system permease protein